MSQLTLRLRCNKTFFLTTLGLEVSAYSYRRRTVSPLRQVCMKSALCGITDGTGSLLRSGNDSQNGRGLGGTPGISLSQATAPYPASGRPTFSVDMLPFLDSSPRSRQITVGTAPSYRNSSVAASNASCRRSFAISRIP